MSGDGEQPYDSADDLDILEAWLIQKAAESEDEELRREIDRVAEAEAAEIDWLRGRDPEC